MSSKNIYLKEFNEIKIPCKLQARHIWENAKLFIIPAADDYASNDRFCWRSSLPGSADQTSTLSFRCLLPTPTLTLILLHQPETTASFGSIHRLCHSSYDLSTPTLIRSSELAIKTPVILPKIMLSHSKLCMFSAKLLARRR